MVKVVRKAGPGTVELAALKQLNGQETRVGWFETSKYEDGTPVAYVASIQHFGYAPKNIPPRLGLDKMLSEKRTENVTVARKVAKLVMKGTPAGEAMGLIGLKVGADIREQIASVTSPALAEATIKARASRTASGEITKTLAKPLVDTGLMLATVSYTPGKGTDPVKVKE